MSRVSALAVTRMMGTKRGVISALSSLRTEMPSSFGIMTSSRTRSGSSVRALECLVTVGRCNHLVSLRAQPNAQHFYIRGIVIDHQYPRRSSQGRHSQIVSISSTTPAQTDR